MRPETTPARKHPKHNYLCRCHPGGHSKSNKRPVELKGEAIMKKTKEKEPDRKQIGVKVNSALWLEMKLLALKQGVTGGELLEEAIRVYLDNHGK